MFVVFFHLFTGDDRNACGTHGLSCGHLVAHLLNRFGRRTDPNQARILDGRGEFRSFRQEAKPWMNGRGVRCGGSGDDLSLVEIGFADGFTVEEHRFIRHFREHTPLVV